jgi:DNA-binding MarR family transcriptional regulator
MSGAVRPGDPDAFEARAAERVVELGDDIDLATFAAMFDLFRVGGRVVSDLEHTVHRPAGLSSAGFRVLFTVWVFESLEPRQIANLSGVSRAAVSGVVGTLERDGFVTRTRQEDDRRLVTVALTDEGRRILAETYRAQNVREREVFAALDPAELEAFTATLRTLLRSL